MFVVAFVFLYFSCDPLSCSSSFIVEYYQKTQSGQFRDGYVPCKTTKEGGWLGLLAKEECVKGNFLRNL